MNVERLDYIQASKIRKNNRMKSCRVIELGLNVDRRRRVVKEEEKERKRTDVDV